MSDSIHDIDCEHAEKDIARWSDDAMRVLGKLRALEEEVVALRAERDEARNEAAEWKRNAEVDESAANAWTDEATKLKAQLEEARAALRQIVEWDDAECPTGKCEPEVWAAFCGQCLGRAHKVLGGARAALSISTPVKPPEGK